MGIASIIAALFSQKSKRIAMALFSISTFLIYFRGYLVPRTPTLTKRYLPADVLQWFGKDSDLNLNSGLGTGNTPINSADSASPTDPTASATSDENLRDQMKLNPEQYLREHGIIESCEDIDDLCLTKEFKTSWLEKIESINTAEISGDDAAAVFDLKTDGTVEIVEFDEARVMRRDGTQVGKWPSHAALVADVAAAKVLERRDPNLSRYSPEQKGQLLMTLRLFLDVCPTSGGTVRMTDETVESCCSSHDIIAIECEETNERLFEHPIADTKI
ncbi:hypothetical protein [Natronococcus sp. A-GB7]|uniref:hypothetical protein n=1 Tax=Natronococcus sp. A-GB7 TaxID=3037649 RepID=UPI00241FB96D|nr:hypothetical protein [Natronococcus sp. A-GB7]MDG5821882.1 hypothetical protein [Natronococcus sp. A-GB7]